MKEVLSPDRVWKIIEKNVWLPRPTWGILRDREWPVFVEADGIYLRDTEGKEYIDATSTAMSATLGYGNRRVIEAIKEQLDKLQFAPVGHANVALLACERIAQVAPAGLNRVSLGCTGSDAVELSLIAARQYFASQGKPNRIIITQWLSYHGLSIGAVGATGMTSFKVNRGTSLADIDSGFYHVLPPYCYRCPYGLEYPQCGIQCAKTIDEVIQYIGPSNVAAFIGEPAFGTSGIATPPPEYWPIVRGICDKHKILLIFDEIVTGWGRLGKLWASEFYGITPDIILTGKGLTGCYLPLSAVVVQDHVFEPFLVEGAPFPALAHTHSFYPLGCAAALAAIDVTIEGKLWENAAEVGTYLKSRLEGIAQKSKVVGAVHGTGLLLGVEIVKDKQSKAASRPLLEAIHRKCTAKGLLILKTGEGNILFIYPPLIITKEQSDKLCGILSEAIEEVEAEIR